MPCSCRVRGLVHGSMFGVGRISWILVMRLFRSLGSVRARELDTLEGLTMGDHGMVI